MNQKTANTGEGTMIEGLICQWISALEPGNSASYLPSNAKTRSNS